MKPFINDKHRISGTRISVYDVYQYWIAEFPTDQIVEILQIAPEEFEAALHYIEANREAVRKRHLELEERNARGNSPEVLAKIEAGRERLEAWKKSIRERMAAREISHNDKGHTGGSQFGGPSQSHVEPSVALPRLD